MHALLLLSEVLAGSGPWVIGTGSRDAFFAVESQRLTRLAIQTAKDEETVIDVGEGLSTFGAKGILTYGLRPGFDLSVTVPWYRVIANRTDAQVCTDLGMSACQTTQGVGILSVNAKALIIDELYGAPLSLSLGGEARYGSFTAPARERITNIGEGTFDLGPALAIGRSMGLGKQGGYLSMWMDGGYRFRFSNTDSYPSTSTGVPGGEVYGDASMLIAAIPWLALGPTVTGLWRPAGLDWYQLDLSDVDRFSALRIYNVRVGGNVVIRTAELPDAATPLSLTVGALRTVAALNNPTDATIVSIGLSVNQPAGG